MGYLSRRTSLQTRMVPNRCIGERVLSFWGSLVSVSTELPLILRICLKPEVSFSNSACWGRLEVTCYVRELLGGCRFSWFGLNFDKKDGGWCKKNTSIDVRKVPPAPSKFMPWVEGRVSWREECYAWQHLVVCPRLLDESSNISDRPTGRRNKCFSYGLSQL